MISKSETVWLSMKDTDGNLVYTITSNADRSMYYIYNERLEKIGRAKSPDELERKFDDARRK